MRFTIGVLVIGVTLGVTLAADQGRGNARGKQDDRPVAVERATRPGTQINIVFSERDIGVIRTHYGTRYKNLPPGLQKKLARGGSLPPGWQKKMEPFPSALERRLVVLSGDHKYGVYDGHAVIYHPITHAILDIVSLF